MYLETLQHSARERTVRALIIGAGEYGFSLVAQSRRTPGLSVSAIHARRTERGVAAFKHAGLPDQAIRPDLPKPGPRLRRRSRLVRSLSRTTRSC